MAPGSSIGTRNAARTAITDADITTAKGDKTNKLLLDSTEVIMITVFVL